jgi:hypothetical protein
MATAHKQTASIAMESKDFSCNDGTKGNASRGAAMSFGDALTKDIWQFIERRVSGFDDRLIAEINAYVNSLFGVVLPDATTSIKISGDEYYNIILPLLQDNKLVGRSSDNAVEQSIHEDKETKKKAPKKGSAADKKSKMSSADKIRFENANKTLVDAVNSAVASFSFTDFHVPAAFNSKILEVRAIGFLQCMLFLHKKVKEYVNKDTKIRFVYNIIVAAEKFISVCDGFVGESFADSSKRVTFSKLLLAETSKMLKKIKTEYNFFGLTVFNKVPGLLLSTDYDSIIPGQKLKLYPTQIMLINEVFDAKVNNKAKVITLRTMTGTGKTTIAVAMAQMLAYNRKLHPEDDQIFVFCCPIKQVLIQAAQLAFNAGIPLAFAHIDIYTGLKIINNYNCKKDSDRILVFCGPEACIEVLKMYPTAILFNDELTMGLDAKDNVRANPFVRANIELLNNLPQISILSSATLTSVPWIFEEHERKFGNSSHVDIYSNKIYIPCELHTLDGEIFVPHSWCRTSTDLTLTIEKIIGNPFLGRAYSANIVYNMFKLFREHNVSSLMDFEQIFMDATNLTADKVRVVAMDLLKELSKCDDTVISAVCSAKITNRESVVEPVKKDDDIVWEEDPSVIVGKDVDYSHLGTTHAHKYTGNTLIATLAPEVFISNFDDLLADFSKKFGSIKKIVSEHEKNCAVWQKQIDRMEQGESKKTGDKKESEIDRLQEEDALRESKPRIDISGFQINTRKHISRYAKKPMIPIEVSAIRGDIDVTDILTAQMNITDNLRILLACGIGIYGHPDGVYNSFVTKMMNDGMLAYIISDVSIAYGTNIPLNRIIATADFCAGYGLNTIYQLISRAGRVGRSDKAEAFLPDSCIENIVASIQSTNVEDDIQVKNLNELHQEFVDISTFNDDELIITLLAQQATKKAAEKKRREEEEAAAQAAEEKRRAEEAAAAYAAEEKRRKEEEDARKLAELKARRTARTGSGQPVNLSTVMNTPPTRNVNLNGFKRETTGDHRPSSQGASSTSQKPAQPSRLERLAKLRT